MISNTSLNPTEGNQVTVYITKGETVSISKRKTASPNYFKAGNGTMNKDKIQSIDLLRELAMASKAGQFILLAIKDGITYENNYSPVVTINRKTLTATQQQYLTTGFKELSAKDLVRRISNGKYMINPNALIPLDYEEALQIWDSVAKRNGKITEE